MGFCVFGGALLSCSFGIMPAPMNVLPDAKVLSSMFAATIMDNKPIANITPFGMCSSMSNPMVIAATAAALGVLTPMPCLPVIPAPWAPGCPTILIGGKPALSDSSKLTCAWGGIIGVNFAGTVNIQLP